MKKKNLFMTAIAIFGLATITSAQVPSYVPTTGLVGYWPFNGNANDESGNGNNGTVNGAALTSDRFGNNNSAYNFNGNGNHILVSYSPNFINPNMSFSGWVNTSQFQTYFNSIVKHGNFTTNAGEQYGIGLSQTGQIHTGFKTSSCTAGQGWDVSITNSTVNLNTWYLLVVTIETNVVKTYLNSSLISTYPYIGSLVLCSANSEIAFGREFSSSANHFYGSLDDIGIWNRALTQQEIADLYNGCQLSVNSQPTNQTININTNTQFAVSSSDPSTTYQWQTDLGVGFQNLNSVGQYSGTTNDTLTVSNVTLSNNNQPFRCIISSGSCTDTSNVAVLTVNNNVGINENTQDNLFSVFPNPAQSVINVKADSKLLGQVYSIYDNTGRVVLTGKLNSDNTTIELGNLSGGVYMFRIGENMKQTFKVIKE